jgi:hypothetical protein
MGGLAPRPFHLARGYGLDVRLLGPLQKQVSPWADMGLPAWSNMWAPQVTEDAKACVEALESMVDHLMSQCAVSS